MPRKTAPIKAQPSCTALRVRARDLLCAFFLLALGTAVLPTHISAVSMAQAQQAPDAATQELFLAVDVNNLQGVRDAIDKGANIEARDFTGTQPVDIAIDRGYFDIARYLISVRNLRQNQQDPTAQIPKMDAPAQQLGEDTNPFEVLPEPPAPPVVDPVVAQTPETVEVSPSLFDVAESGPELADLPEPQNPSLETQPRVEKDATRAPDQTSERLELKVDTEVPQPVARTAKDSAAKTFITTFFDFFKPPNVTGVIRREQGQVTQNAALSDVELAQELDNIRAERGTDIIKGPAVPFSPDELAQERPPAPQIPAPINDELAAAPLETPELVPYSVGSVPTPEPFQGQEDPFGELSIEDATPQDEQPLEASVPITSRPSSTASKPSYREAPGVPGRRYDSDKPFGGGVDPDILAFLGLDPRTALPSEAQVVAKADDDDPFASLGGADDNPFDLLEGADDTNISDLLEGLGEPQDVAERTPRSPPPPGGASDDPFATLGPLDDVDELAGLLESTNEDVSGTQGWDVTRVDGADLPSEVIVLTDIEASGQILDGVELTLGSDTTIGQEVGAERLKLMEQKTIHKPCLAKGGNDTLFCVDKVSWPFELEEDFLVDTIMYQGTRAIARYDAGRASNYHTMFRSTSFEKVVGYYTQRYGQPSQVIERAIAPLAAPRQDNPTYLWQSREPGTDTISTLEIRKFNDAQGGFPDTLRGVILLYRNHAKSIFPQLSQLELMVLKADNVAAAEESLGGVEDSSSIWN
ncbi:MAG: ankyrin repeat domain-containing protein [Magnetovibrio sp.]|nr:ankyrin repeat domain-containing protein [Magnetovibrio sp.]